MDITDELRQKITHCAREQHIGRFTFEGIDCRILDQRMVITENATLYKAGRVFVQWYDTESKRWKFAGSWFIKERVDIR
jgi:hypothetical protein